MAHGIPSWLSGLGADLRDAWRLIRRRPVWSAAIVLVLGLGLAGNVAMFAGFEAWVLRPLDLRDAERLVDLFEHRPRLAGGDFGVSPPTVADLGAPELGLDRVAVYRRDHFNLGADDGAERVLGTRVSSGLLPLLGAEPRLGRSFAPEDDRPGRPAPVVLLGDRLWRERFAAAPDVVGRGVEIDGREHVVVGVMPPGFAFPEWSELWVPLGLDPLAAQRDERAYNAVGRLAPGVTLEALGDRLDELGARLAARHPETNAGWRTGARPLRRIWAPPVIETALGASMIAALAVLLVVCANVANLLLAHAAARRHEVALRSALGAGRGRLFRQSLVLCLALALAASGVGVALGALWLRSLLGSVPVEPPYLFQMRLDLRALLFTLVLALAVAVVCALVPLLRASGRGLATALRAGGRGGDGSTGRRLRSALIVGEVALSTFLLVVALLMVRSFLQRQDTPPGYRLDGLQTVELAFDEDGADGERRGRRLAEIERLRAALSSLEPVRSIEATTALPASQYHSIARVEAEGRPLERDEAVHATLHGITAGYLDQLAIELVDGRPFSTQEVREGRDVIIVSDSLARRLWGTEDVIGRSVVLPPRDRVEPRTVVGVARSVPPPREIVSYDVPEHQLYLPLGATAVDDLSLVLETDAAAASLTPELRRRLRAAGLSIPLSEVLAMREVLERTRWVTTFFSRQLGIFALLALAVAGLGLYGLIAEATEERRREMAVRLALGSAPGELRRRVLGQGLALVLLGLAVGLPIAFGLARFGAAMLIDVSARDPLTYVVVATLLVAVAVVAGWWPARRAARTDPAVTLRAE